MLLTLVAVLMNFCSAEIALAAIAEPTNRDLTPSECIAYKIGCTCYAPPQLKKIYVGLTTLEKCAVALREKDSYIKDRLVTWGAGQPVAFWQEPSWIMGGVVVSAGITAGITVWLLKRP